VSGTPDGAAVLEITGVSRGYSGLRPLRLRALSVARGERVAISGLDGAAAEVLVNLVTGASLPDAGQVRVLGQNTADIVDGDKWLASLDRFGIMSPRGVLLEGATLAQNLAMPFTLEIDPVPPDTRAAVDTLAEECGIPRGSLEDKTGESSPAIRARVHFARAIALGPMLLVMEHPTATIPDADRQAFAADVVRACEARSQTLLAITLDQEFATAVAHRALALQPATGALAPLGRRRWWR
jgi:ABC-type lipoprotein export system ATPase subunit